MSGSFNGENATKQESLTFEPIKGSGNDKKGYKEYSISFRLETTKTNFVDTNAKEYKETGTITVQYKPKKEGKDGKSETKTFEYYSAK